MSNELIDLDDAMVELAHILTPYDHDNWEQTVFYDKRNERFVIRYRAYVFVESGARIYSDSVRLPVKYDDAVRILKDNNSSAFYDDDLKQVKHAP